jgi:hypothetical protein
MDSWGNRVARAIATSLLLIILAAGYVWCGPLPATDIVVSGGENNSMTILATTDIFDPGTLTFSVGPTMAHSRVFHAQVPLGGRFILIAGGIDKNNNPLDDAELLDRTTGTFTSTGSLGTFHAAPAFAMLDSMHALIASGENSTTPTLTKAAEVYSLKTRTFSPTGNMATARILSSAAKIGNFVLVTGGTDASNHVLKSAELYDSKAGTFTILPDMSTPRVFHTITALNGRFALVAGGESTQVLGTELASAELFDLKTRTFSALPDMHIERTAPAATRLNGKFVLITGGLNAAGIANDTAEMFDLVHKTFIPVGNMTVPRLAHMSALITGGRVLVVGGSSMNAAMNALDSSEVFDPKTKAFTASGNMSDDRVFPAASAFH